MRQPERAVKRWSPDQQNDDDRMADDANRKHQILPLSFKKQHALHAWRLQPRPLVLVADDLADSVALDLCKRSVTGSFSSELRLAGLLTDLSHKSDPSVGAAARAAMMTEPINRNEAGAGSQSVRTPG